MSKLRCGCGGIIYDGTDYLPYKGYLTPDTIYFDQFDQAKTDIAAYLQARESGAERQWLMTYFGEEFSKNPLPSADIIHDIFARHLFRGQLHVYQCPSCRRLLIQKNDQSRHFHAFSPDDIPKPDIFAQPKAD